MKVNKYVIGLITIAGVTAATAANPWSQRGGEGWGEGHSRSVEKIAAHAAEKFAQLDVDASGTISQEEFAALPVSHRRHRRGHHGPPKQFSPETREQFREQFSDKMFEAADLDGDGSLSREEARNMRAQAPEVMRKLRFTHMDKNDDSVLTPDEFPPFASRVREMDTNGDGEISRDEIRAYRHNRPDAG